MPVQPFWDVPDKLFMEQFLNRFVDKTPNQVDMQKKITPPTEIKSQISKTNSKELEPSAKLLLSFTLATACTAVVIKTLKRSELALLAGLILIPVALVCLKNKTGPKCCEKY